MHLENTPHFGPPTPRNLAVALADEVGELLAEIQWLADNDIISELEAGGAH